MTGVGGKFSEEFTSFLRVFIRLPFYGALILDGFY